MTDADGWITHDGGPCPVAPGRLVMLNGGTDMAIPAEDAVWSDVTRYRVFALVIPGPSPFVAETAARIMAAMAAADRTTDHDLLADDAVRAALALEAALKEVKP